MLNPILIWEIILRQQFDKVMRIDEDTILYNIEIRKEYSLTDKHLIKVIHILKKNIMLILTDELGYQLISKIMKKLFKFAEIEKDESLHNEPVPDQPLNS